jgi:alpha-galactosidase
MSAPRSRTRPAQLPLDFRAATALFGHFGIEWDLTTASAEDLAALAGWAEVYKAEVYKAHRALLHSGRTVRLDSTVGDAWVYGVVAHDASAAVMAYAQLDELQHEPPAFRVPGLDRSRRYTVTRLDPASWPAYDVPTKAPVSGAALADVGLPGPPAAPVSVVVIHLQEAE